MKKVITGLFLVIFLLVNTAQAEVLKAVIVAPDEEVKLTFPEALQKALELNHQLNAAKYDVLSQEKRIGVQKSNFYPQLNFGQDFVWLNTPADVFGLTLNQRRLTAAAFAGAPGTFNNPAPLTNFLSNVSLQQTLFSRKDIINLRIAKNDYTAKNFELRRTEETVAMEVSKAYLMAKTAAEYVKVAQQAVLDSREHLRLATVRYNNQVGLYSDVLRTQTALKKAEQNLVSAEKNYMVAKKGLGLTIGINKLVDVDNIVPLIEVSEYKDYKDNYTNRADINAVEMNYKNAENAVKLAKSAYFPELKAGGNYSVYSKSAPFGYDGNYFQLYGMFKWNIFDGKRKRKELDIAKFELGKAGEYLAGQKEKAQFEIFEAYKTVEEKAKNLEYAQVSMDSAQEGMRLIEVRYKNSLSPVLDLLDAQLNLDQTRAELIKSRNEYVFSVLNLSYASGTILEDLGLKN